jgi:hypothetical protein
MFLIDDILFAPLKGLVWLAEKVDEVAEKELSDEGQLMDKLMELQLRFELDEISEEEYTEKENELLERLDNIRNENESEDDEQK